VNSTKTLPKEGGESELEAIERERKKLERENAERKRKLEELKQKEKATAEGRCYMKIFDYATLSMAKYTQLSLKF